MTAKHPNLLLVDTAIQCCPFLIHSSKHTALHAKHESAFFDLSCGNLFAHPATYVQELTLPFLQTDRLYNQLWPHVHCRLGT